EHAHPRRRGPAHAGRGRHHVPGRPEDGHPLGEVRQADLDPHARRAPPLPRGRGARPAGGHPRPARAAGL
ncbi:MAG: hypothetical protein AVDCRST_MAG16-1002, partial [uncultured Frankineae bacterium]